MKTYYKCPNSNCIRNGIVVTIQGVPLGSYMFGIPHSIICGECRSLCERCEEGDDCKEWGNEEVKIEMWPPPADESTRAIQDNINKHNDEIQNKTPGWPNLLDNSLEEYQDLHNKNKEETYGKILKRNYFESIKINEDIKDFKLQRLAKEILGIIKKTYDITPKGKSNNLQGAFETDG